MKQRLFNITQAARHKGVSRQALYDAIEAGRLKAIEVLGKPAIRESDLEAWQPQPGQKKGQPRSKAVKVRISAAVKASWAKRKLEEK